MNPDEIKTIIENAIEAKSLVPIWTYILLVILPLVGAFFGAYSKKMGENKALRDDFKNALNRIELQVNSVKVIEERISHSYLETREISRIKREKIELIYLELNKEREMLGHNLTVTATNLSKDVIWQSNIVQMLVSLYFKDELKQELDYYIEQRRVLITLIRELSQENLNQLNIDEIERYEENMIYFKNFNQATVNIEIALAEQMKNLTSH